MDADPVDEMVQLIVTAQADAMKRGALSMWTIYCRPTDFPTMHIARRSEVGPGGTQQQSGEVLQADGDKVGLTIMRVVMARCGLTCITRDDSDPAQIVETWL
jgi:hypothetical protein